MLVLSRKRWGTTNPNVVFPTGIDRRDDLDIRDPPRAKDPFRSRANLER
jgi:hypothetical protein